MEKDTILTTNLSTIMYLLILNSFPISIRRIFDSPEEAAVYLFDLSENKTNEMVGLYKIDVISQTIIRVPIPKIQFEYQRG